MAYGKKNEVKLDILHYNIALLGESGIGKTTLIKNVIEKYTKNSASALFIETSMESGADCINGINYINCLEWEDEYNEFNNSVGFSNVIDDIVERKTEEYPELKVVVIDTIDQLITLAEAETIRLWNIECRNNGKNEKIAKTIKQTWGGFDAPGKVVMKLIFDAISRLRKVGVATIIIGHVKSKQIDDTFSGQSYQILTSDLQQSYFGAIKKNIHFLGLAYVDREIAKKKTGKKNIVTGKEEVVGKVESEARKIRFRDDGNVSDCKSRFADIVPEINLDADEFIKALQDAILAEHKKSGKTIEQTQAEQKKNKEAEEKRIAEAEKKNNEKNELEKVISEIVKFFTNNKSNLTVIKPILDKIKELGYANPKEIDSLDDAKIIFELIK